MKFGMYQLRKTISSLRKIMHKGIMSISVGESAPVGMNWKYSPQIIQSWFFKRIQKPPVNSILQYQISTLIGCLNDLVWRNIYTRKETKSKIFKPAERPIITYALETREHT